MVLQFWKDNYDLLPDNASHILNDSTLTFTGNFKNWKNHYTVASGIEDEYVRCCASEPIFCQSARESWPEPTQEENYQNICEVAMGILTITSMSAASQLLFLRRD